MFRAGNASRARVTLKIQLHAQILRVHFRDDTFEIQSTPTQVNKNDNRRILTLAMRPVANGNQYYESDRNAKRNGGTGSHVDPHPGLAVLIRRLCSCLCWVEGRTNPSKWKLDSETCPGASASWRSRMTNCRRNDATPSSRWL